MPHRTLKKPPGPRLNGWTALAAKEAIGGVLVEAQSGIGVGSLSLADTRTDPLAAGMSQDLVNLVENLYGEHYHRLYRYMLRSGCSESQADDYLQEAFLRLFRFLKQGNVVEKPKYWLLRVIRNIRIDDGRLHRHEAVLDEKELEAGAMKAFGVAPDAESESMRLEWNEAIRTAIAGLPRRQYEYLLLRAEGLKLREIADMHNVSVQTVSEAIARAVDRIGRVAHD